ncbi:MAG: hypothetical protein JXR70_03000 [Spirochaetales bacterium]|nr:hypothetical protein [Spirochaetales bacterium]
MVKKQKLDRFKIKHKDEGPLADKIETAVIGLIIIFSSLLDVIAIEKVQAITRKQGIFLCIDFLAKNDCRINAYSK